MAFERHSAVLLGSRFLRFGIVGVIATLIHFLVLVISVELFGLQPTPGSAIGFVISAGVNYYLNYKFTFASTNPHMFAFPRFMLAALVGLALNISVMSLLTIAYSLFYLAAQIVATLVTLTWNFLANNFWSFRTYDTEI